MTEDIKQTFFKLLNKDLTIPDFEKWIYKSNPTLEAVLPAEFNLDLISFNFKQKDSFHNLVKLIMPQIDENEYNIWRTKKLLVEIINDNIDLVLATRELAMLYFETGENFIPVTLGIGYESELDDVPTPDEYKNWDKNVLLEKLEKVKDYRDEIKRDAKLFLDLLNNKK
jgi:hypothetical protein